MAGENEPNPWIAAGQAAHDRAVRTQDQAIETQDQGVATQDEAVVTQDVAFDHPLRIARGDMTQQELSDVSGVSRRRISQIESGAKGASAEIAANLAAALNTTPEALGFGGSAPPPRSESTHPVAVARRDAGLSQGELALQAGVSPSVISRLEGGQRAHPQMEHAHAIAEALGGDVESLGLIPSDLHPLARQRWVQGLSQQELADASGVPYRRIRRIEEGERDLDPETRAAIAAVVAADVGTVLPAPTREVDATELVGARLREERTALGLSTRALAERAGTSKSVVDGIESGRTANPSYASVSAIGAALVESGADFVLTAELDLAAERAQLGISQTDLAQYTSLNNRQLSEMETGATTPRVAAVADVRQALSRIAAEQDAAAGRFDLSAERTQLGLTRGQLAERLGVTIGEVEAFESGRTRLDAQSITEVRRALLRAEVEQLRDLRRQLKLTQHEVDAQAGLRLGTSSDVETGSNQSPETVAAIRAALMAADPPLDLAAERDRLGLTQTELAERADVSKGTVSAVEAGARPTAEIDSALRNALRQAAEEGLENNAQIDFDLAQAREDLGLSQQQLADLAGVDRRTVAAVEEGRGPQGHLATTNAAIREALRAAKAEPPAGRALDFDVADVRERLGLSRGELAARAGISAETLASVEEGGRPVGAQAATNAAIRGALAGAVSEAVSAHDLDPAAVRGMLDLTVADLARLADVREATLHDWESGATARPRDATVEAVRGALDDAARTFFEGRTEQAEAGPQGDVFRDREVADLTVEELAELSGVPAAEITRIENDPGYRPSAATMRAVREGLNEADVRRFDGVEPEAGPLPGPEGTESEQRTAPTPEASSEDRGAAGESAVPLAEGSVSVPVGPLRVDVPDAPARPDLPPAPPLPPHLARLGEQAAYFDASMRGYPAGRQTGAAAAAAAEVPWGQEAGAAGRTPVLNVDRGGERLAEARRTAAENDVGADEQVGVDWAAEAPFTAPVGAAVAAQGADALREATFSEARPGSGLTAAQVHEQRFQQAAWDGFQQGWAQTMTERVLLAAQDHPELAAPDVTPDMQIEALAAIGHAPSGPPQATPARPEGERGTRADPEPVAERDADPGGVTQPEAASGARGVDDPAPGSDASGPETSGPEPTPETGRSESAPQLPGPTPSALDNPAALGLSTAETRSTSAPEQSVDESQPAPAPAPELSPGPGLEQEQSKET
ncbi:helix-turn-helix domain-containing protein [Streptodolium elevatio]